METLIVGLKNNVFNNDATIAAITILAFEIRDYHPNTIEAMLNLLKDSKDKKVKDSAARALQSITYPASARENSGTNYYRWEPWLDNNITAILNKKGISGRVIYQHKMTKNIKHWYNANSECALFILSYNFED